MSGISSSNRSPPNSQSAESSRDNIPVAIGDGTTVEAADAASGVVTTMTETAAADVVTETELAYIAGNKSIRSLVVLSHGLKKDDGSDLMDIKNEEPWKSIPRIEIKPTADLFKAEIQRRHRVFGLTKAEPRPASWRSSKISQWLFEHPIEKDADLEFLKRTIANCRQQISQDSRFHRHFERHAPPPGVAATTTGDGGESVPSVVTKAGSRTNQTSHSRTNQTSHSRSNVESAIENTAVPLGNFVKEDRVATRTTDGGESVPRVVPTADSSRTNQPSHSRSSFESAFEKIAVALCNFVKDDRKRRLEDRMDAISAEKRKVRRLLIESRQAANDELHDCYKQELDELASNERRIQETLETL
ncbi:hypothetical protein IV203_037103 [Nitzschia inconspicua]|uniref:Uncharacterized protein n=1 Tax=Nitzschia inconspicua TaxID=303405 RepID=A0A9K3LP18_9STRA|nr:hypothetical protein IV203_037103 [Nitzschia inconspicua]